MNFAETLDTGDCDFIVGFSIETYEMPNQPLYRKSGYSLYLLQSSYPLQSSYQLKKHYKQWVGGCAQRQVAHTPPEGTDPNQAGLSGPRSYSFPLREQSLSQSGRSRWRGRAAWQLTHDRTPTTSRSQFVPAAATTVNRPGSLTRGSAMSSVQSSTDVESQADDSHVVHGVWRCEECDAGRVCSDAADRAEQHAAETEHETSAESTVFATFDGDSDAESTGGRL